MQDFQEKHSGDVNNLTGYTGEYMDKLVECIPLADDAVYDTDARIRYDCTNRILHTWGRQRSRSADLFQHLLSLTKNRILLSVRRIEDSSNSCASYSGSIG